jgi:hypothetical protein
MFFLNHETWLLPLSAVVFSFGESFFGYASMYLASGRIKNPPRRADGKDRLFTRAVLSEAAAQIFVFNLPRGVYFLRIE